MPRCLIHSRFPRLSIRCYKRPRSFLILTNLHPSSSTAILPPSIRSIYTKNIRGTSLHLVSIPAAAMSDSEMDEETKRAIALSLEQNSSPVPSREKSVVDLTISDDDDDLDAPVTTHLQFSQPHIPNTNTDAKTEANPQGIIQLVLSRIFVSSANSDFTCSAQSFRQYTTSCIEP